MRAMMPMGFFGLLTWLGSAGMACEPVDGGNDGDSDSDTDTDTDTDADTDSDTDTDTDTDTDPVDPNDKDGDGWSVDEDCDDYNEFVNPMAIEDLGPDGEGDLVDNDCDGETDEASEYCDCPTLSNSELEMARAIGFCDDRFIISITKDMTSTGGAVAFDTLTNQGVNNCLLPRDGCEMSVISSGPVGQADPNMAQSMSGIANVSIDPLPAFQGDTATTSTVQASCDRSQLRLTLLAPSNAKGFSFDFLFGSAEYDEWVNQGFNDTFYAIMEDADLNGGATTNIAFDDNDNEIEVDTNFFENSLYPCNEAGSGWEPETPSVSGSTGWLRTAWTVAPNATFALTFSIHDEGDCIYDSIAFIDNFRWSTEPVEPGTTPIID